MAKHETYTVGRLAFVEFEDSTNYDDPDMYSADRLKDILKTWDGQSDEISRKIIGRIGFELEARDTEQKELMERNLAAGLELDNTDAI